MDESDSTVATTTGRTLRPDRAADATPGIAPSGSFADSHHAGTIPATPALAARVRFLAEFDAALRRAEPDLARLAEAEIGKSPFDTLTAEILPLLASLRWHRRHLARLLAPRRLRGRAWWQFGQRHWTLRLPVGRVAIIATWNYPIQLLGVQLAQAIAAGNRVCVKPSERSPRTQARLLDAARAALDAAGLAAETIEVRPATRDEGAAMLRRERFDHILFTGSSAVGQSIAEAAAATLTPTTLELSGRDSAFVLADADPLLAARTLWFAVTLNAGQTCMAPRRILVDRRVAPAFLAALAPLVAGAKPLRLVDREAAMATYAAARGAIVRGGRSLTGTLEPPAEAALVPIAIADCPAETELFAGRHFGPAVAIHAFDALEDALALHERIGHALATSVFSRRPDPTGALAARLGSGLVTWNDCIVPSAHPAAPIVGRGRSGWGPSRGASGLVALTREVTVSATGRFRVPLEPPTASGLAWLRRLAGLRPSSPTPSGKDIA